MKEKIIYFLIGLLAGAVISTGSIFIYTLAAKDGDNNGQQSMQMPGGQPGEGGPMNNNGGTPPEMPNNNNAQTN